MNKTYFDWKLSSGERIHSVIATPTEAAKRVIILVHGIGEHFGRYDHWIDKFLNDQTAVIASDQLGHGRSEGRRGVVPSFDIFYEIINKGITTATLHFPGEPIFLYGHSMGGLEVLSYCMRKKPEINGVVATAPSLKLINVPEAQIRIVKVLKRFIPGTTIKNGLALNGLSKIPNVADDYRRDKLVHNRSSLKLALSIYEEGVWTREHASDLGTPAFIAFGSKDILVDPVGAREFIQNGGGNIQSKEYPEGYHELHNDLEADDLFRTLTNWFNKVENA